MILARLASKQLYKEITIDHLEQFAHEGFRTLLIAFKEIQEDDYKVNYKLALKKLTYFLTISDITDMMSSASLSHLIT